MHLILAYCVSWADTDCNLNWEVSPLKTVAPADAVWIYMTHAAGFFCVFTQFYLSTPLEFQLKSTRPLQGSGVCADKYKPKNTHYYQLAVLYLPAIHLLNFQVFIIRLTYFQELASRYQDIQNKL